MISAPSAAQVYAARDGRPGSPTYVRIDAETTALRNLARKGADPWVCTRVVTREGVSVVEIATAILRGVYIDSRRIDGADVQRFDALLLELPPEHARHSRAGELARERCARISMGIVDAHVRALCLTFSDSWGFIGGKVLNESAAHGTLFDAPPGMLARVLVVTCPSTSRKYGHAVPSEMCTARDARRWIMGLKVSDPDPDVET